MPARPSKEKSSNPAIDAFASSTLTIVPNENRRKGHQCHLRPSASDASITNITLPSECHQTCAYYRDSSGRARIHLRVRLKVPQECGGAEALLECGCIQPIPVEKFGDIPENLDAGGVHAERGEGAGSSGEKAKNRNNNSSDDEDNEEDDPWQKELSTIGKDIGGEARSPWFVDTTCTFECTISSTESRAMNDGTINNSNMWAVEGVTIKSSEIERLSPKTPKSPISALLFDIEVAIRGNGIVCNGVSGNDMLEEGGIELCAALKQRTKYRSSDGDSNYKIMQGHNRGDPAAKSLLGRSDGNAGVAAGLLGLELGGGAISPNLYRHPPLPTSGRTNGSKYDLEMHYGTKVLRTSPPVRICATLIPPLQLTVREVCGARAASGSTLVEITVEHSSQWHSEDVTVTGIAFHPGQSRLWDGSDEGYLGEGVSSISPSEGKSMQGGELSVIDMSRRVRWGFAPGTAPELPLVLSPYEALATVIQIDAGEDVRSRAFLSPISVNAMIGFSASKSQNNSKPGGKHDGKAGNKSLEAEGERIMITTDARWTTSRVAVENSDAFRVDMSLRGGLQTVCRVGAPLIVSLRVLNLSMEPRDLMLLMAKDGEGRNNGGLQWERPKENRAMRGRAGNRHVNVWGGTMIHNRAYLSQAQSQVSPKENHSFNTAVVSEVNGYTFGVWGLSGDDDGTTRHHRDHELLAVDAALLLGEVKGQHSIEAELRFVPLREGTLDVPNLKLYDKRGGRWYNCVHTLKIVAAAKA